MTEQAVRDRSYVEIEAAAEADAREVRAPRLTRGHRQVVQAADLFFGGFCMMMLAVAGIAWWTGAGNALGFFAILAFLLANVVMSQISIHVDRPFAIEVLRIIVGGIVAPTAYLLVSAPLGPWWPGMLIMALGGSIVLGLLTQNPLWGRLLVVYYVGILGIAHAIGMPSPDWYALSVQGGVVAMVGLMFAQIMSMLGQTLQSVHDRSVELKHARDALFAEMEVAQEIQTLLLPKKPVMPDHVVDGHMVPATEVGGDYYDVLSLNHGRRRVFLAIGDVSGHGVTSGLTMMMARASLMGALEANPTGRISDLYRVLNRCLRQNLARMDLNMYMTFVLLEYEGQGQFVAVGRHLPLLIYRAAEKKVEEIEVKGMWLGVLDDLEPEHIPPTHFNLGKGDLLFLYTDGIVEQMQEEGEMFGFERLTETVRDHGGAGPSKVITAVLDQLGNNGPAQEDDVTMLAIGHTGAVAATN